MGPIKCIEKRKIEIPDCKETNPRDCRRSFLLYLPDIVCGGDGRGPGRLLEHSSDTPPGNNADEPAMETVVGTLPLVFGIHCFGCTTASISTFIEHANAHNVVLVLPQGIQNSFNARHCCGYALANEIDDVGFLKYIQSTLSDEYEFVQSDFSYAVGWSNGGFMVMHAASLFRSISPISGYIPEIDQSLTKGGTFCVDNICVDAPGAGKGIFLHHSVDDQLVRPTGCCNDPDLPKCCCNIAADTCSSVTDVASNWADRKSVV